MSNWYKNRTFLYLEEILQEILMILISIIFYWMKNYTIFFLIHDVAYKILLDLKPLRIIFVKVDGYIWNYDETKYLLLFHSKEKCERIFYRITYLFKLKSNNLGAYKYTKIKINADDDLLYCRILW